MPTHTVSGERDFRNCRVVIYKPEFGSVEAKEGARYLKSHSKLEIVKEKKCLQSFHAFLDLGCICSIDSEALLHSYYTFASLNTPSNSKSTERTAFQQHQKQEHKLSCVLEYPPSLYCVDKRVLRAFCVNRHSLRQLSIQGDSFFA